MSQWTHVAAVIRFDALRLPGMPDMSPQLGTPARWDDGGSFDKCDMPCGSEGSLDYAVWENPHTNSISAYTVMIWGDLRDYQDVDEIAAYLDRITSGKMIRSGVAEIDVEFHDKIVLRHNCDHENGAWTEVARIPHAD